MKLRGVQKWRIKNVWRGQKFQYLEIVSFWLLENLPWLILKVLVLLVPIQDQKYGCVTKTDKNMDMLLKRDIDITVNELHKSING